jgi:uncharacterized membrane protein
MFESLEIVLIAIIGLFIVSIILIIIRDIIRAILDRFK